jgi:myo-inositol-1-phosphate synthase
MQKYEIEFTNLLKNKIKQEGYYSSGKLYNSIKFNINNNYELVLNSLEYIQYLDDGKFLEDFYESNEFVEVYQQFIAEIINNVISDSL